MGMALIYTGAGSGGRSRWLAAAGDIQSTLGPDPVFRHCSSFLFAFGMFGAFELQMPSAIQSKLAGASGNQKSGTMIGAFVMGSQFRHWSLQLVLLRR